MTWAIVIIVVAALLFAGLVVLKQHQQIVRLSDLLASRSYGEFAAGQAKLKAPEKKPEQPVDLGF